MNAHGLAIWFSKRKLAVIAKLKETWFGIDSLPLRTVKPSQVSAWLTKHYRKRTEPIRPTPTFEQFQQIVADIRGQRFNADADQSGDFVEWLGVGRNRTG